MTCALVTRGAEWSSRWTDRARRLSSEAEEFSRMPGGAIRLRPVLTCAFVILALFLMLADSFRLAQSARSHEISSAETQQVSNQPDHRIAHARIPIARRQPGV
jgi:hypothetical protein